MKRTAGFLVTLALLAVAFVTSTKAETVQAGLVLSPANEVPPIAGLNASAAFQITVTVVRDANGAITSGSVRVSGSVAFPGSVTFTGLHIHEGAATTTGPVVIGTDINNSTNSITFTSGAGLIDKTVENANVAVLGRLLKNPAGFYVNLHTTANGSGAVRGQLIRFEERMSQTVELSTAREIPQPTNGLSGTGVATITASPVRNETGVVTGGTVTFTMQYDLPAGSVLRGLHIHEGPIDNTGPIVIDTGLSANNTVTLTNGKGSANFVVPITATSLEPFKRLLANPGNFYVNVHTSANPAGIIRNQLSALTAPPILQSSDTYFLETGSTDAQLSVLATGIDLTSTALINGQTIVALPDFVKLGYINVIVPAALRANPGTLFLQARTGAGLMSAPIQIIVAPAASVNTVAAATVDAAKFGAGAAPDSISALFGTKLASATVSAPATGALPTSLDGTSVYVNGVTARLFFVSAGQINYLVPPGTAAGPAQIVVVAKDGSVSRGTVNITPSFPGIFTRTANGTGAPAAVASTDGAAFTIAMSNPDGTPVAIDAGNFVALFGTGFRFASGAMTMSIGGTPVTPLGFAAQSEFAGLDQANVQIPANFAGRGDVDLTLTVDGKTSNVVKLKIK
jgi:uncharacterized protein (TIGR03437 family)